MKRGIGTRAYAHLIHLYRPAAASAVAGVFTDPRGLGEMPPYIMPEKFYINDNMVTPPASPEESEGAEILRGPNIKPFPVNTPLSDSIEAKVSLKVGVSFRFSLQSFC